MEKKQTLTIDAAGKTLGRVASEAAKALMGKTSPSYVPHIQSGARVTIVNAAKLHSTERKRNKTIHSTYSGFPGGLKHESLSSLNARRGHGEALRRSIERMMPRNRLRTARMKNLTVTE
jgi:large subunit ribosomal protein L13